MRTAGALLVVSLLAACPAWAEPPVAPPPGSEPPSPATSPVPPSASPAPPPPAVPPAASPAESAPSPPSATGPTPDESTAADLAAARAAAPEASPALPPVSRPGNGPPPQTEVTIDRRNAFVAGVRFGGPTGATVRLSLLHGLGADVREKDERVDVVCSVPIPHCAGGFVLDAEAGTGGGKLSMGVGANAKVQDEDFRGTVGAGLKLSVTRTWGSPIGTDPGLTYLGPELDLYVLRVGVNLGVLWRIAGDGGSSAVFSWGLGIRL